MSTNTRAAAREIADRCLAVRVRMLGRVVSRVFDEALRPFGVTAAQTGVLVVAALHGPLAAAEIGRALHIEKSTLSRNLRVMATRGWIESGDGVALTPAGERLLESVLPTWRGAQQRAEEVLGTAGSEAVSRAAESLWRSAP